MVDFIGRFENLGADFQTVQSKIGIPVRRIQHNNSSGIGASQTLDQTTSPESVSSSDLDYLADRFSRDFHNF